MKKQLHVSQLRMLEECGQRYYYRYIENIIMPPGIALNIGTATHKSIEKNLKSKIETGELLPIEQVKDIARDEAHGLAAGELYLTDEEAENPQAAVGEMVDMSITLASLHALELAPILQPKAVERKWVINLENFPFDLAGTIDIEETTGSIRDTKTAGKTPSQTDADCSEQLTMYSLAKIVCDGQPPTALYLDGLVKLKTPKVTTLVTQRSDAQRTALMRRIERAAEIIDKQVFMPTNSDDWRCSKKFCGYHRICPFYSGK